MKPNEDAIIEQLIKRFYGSAFSTLGYLGREQESPWHVQVAAHVIVVTRLFLFVVAITLFTILDWLCDKLSGRAS